MLLQSGGLSLNSILREIDFKNVLNSFASAGARCNPKGMFVNFLNQDHYRGGEIHALDDECRRESHVSDTPHHRSVCLCVAMGSHTFVALTESVQKSQNIPSAISKLRRCNFVTFLFIRSYNDPFPINLHDLG